MIDQPKELDQDLECKVAAFSQEWREILRWKWMHTAQRDATKVTVLSLLTPHLFKKRIRK